MAQPAAPAVPADAADAAPGGPQAPIASAAPPQHHPGAAIVKKKKASGTSSSTGAKGKKKKKTSSSKLGKRAAAPPPPPPSWVERLRQHTLQGPGLVAVCAVAGAVALWQGVRLLRRLRSPGGGAGGAGAGNAKAAPGALLRWTSTSKSPLWQQWSHAEVSIAPPMPALCARTPAQRRAPTSSRLQSAWRWRTAARAWCGAPSPPTTRACSTPWPTPCTAPSKRPPSSGAAASQVAGRERG